MKREFDQPPQPRAAKRVPRYPRLLGAGLGIGLSLAAANCNSVPGWANPGGAQRPVFDGGAPVDLSPPSSVDLARGPDMDLPLGGADIPPWQDAGSSPDLNQSLGGGRANVWDDGGADEGTP